MFRIDFLGYIKMRWKKRIVRHFGGRMEASRNFCLQITVVFFFFFLFNFNVCCICYPCLANLMRVCLLQQYNCGHLAHICTHSPSPLKRLHVLGKLIFTQKGNMHCVSSYKCPIRTLCFGINWIFGQRYSPHQRKIARNCATLLGSFFWGLQWESYELIQLVWTFINCMVSTFLLHFLFE